MDLRSDETVIFQGHPSWRAILGFYLQWTVAGAVAAGIAALVTLVSDGVDLGIVILIFVVVWGAGVSVARIRRIATTYSITIQRLHIKRGIVSRKIHQTRIQRVQ